MVDIWLVEHGFDVAVTSIGLQPRFPQHPFLVEPIVHFEPLVKCS